MLDKHYTRITWRVRIINSYPRPVCNISRMYETPFIQSLSEPRSDDFLGVVTMHGRHSVCVVIARTRNVCGLGILKRDSITAVTEKVQKVIVEPYFNISWRDLKFCVGLVCRYRYLVTIIIGSQNTFRLCQCVKVGYSVRKDHMCR